MDNYKKFCTNIDNFINKYYKNLLIKGSILFIVLFVVIILSVSLLEYFGWFNNSVRLFLFLSSVISILFIFSIFIIVPVLRLFKVANRITIKHSSKIIQSYFPNVKDQIINIIELKEKYENENSIDLVNASIEQKSENLNKFNFSDAVKYSSNKVFLYYFAIIFIVALFIFVSKPEIISQGSIRIINYNKYFEKNVGYSVIIDTTLLNIERGSDLNLVVNIVGNISPENLFIRIGNNSYILSKTDNNQYTYLIKSINQSFLFTIHNSEYVSKNYKINVLEPPVLIKYNVNIQYADYLNKPDEIFKNISDLDLPVGSNIELNFYTKDIDSLFFKTDSVNLKFEKKEEFFKLRFILKKSVNYSVVALNKYFAKPILNGSIKAIPDLYPAIAVKQAIDETNLNKLYFKGLITDDYGFTKLNFVVNNNVYNIPIQGNTNNQDFFYMFEQNDENKNIEFYFEVFDNDLFSGPKRTKSQFFTHKFPELSEIFDRQAQKSKEVEEKLDKSLLLAKELQLDIKDMQKSIITDKLSDWEKKSMLNSISQKQKELENLVEQIAKQNFEKNNNINNDEILEKQKAIQELLDNVISDEIKELMKKIEDLQKQFDNKQFNELAKDLSHNYDDLSKELDRNLELLKRFEIEKNIDDVSEILNKISNEQLKLSDELLSDSVKSNKLLEKNNQNADDIQSLKDKYQEILKSNQSLEKPFKLDNYENEFEQLKSDVENNSKNISESNNEQSSENSKQNSKKAKELADKIESMLKSSSAGQQAEDADAIRILLENLFYISFEQELLNKQLVTTYFNDPLFVKILTSQKQLYNNYIVIRDSLYAIGKRTEQINSGISKKAFDIEDNLLNTDEALNAQNIGLASKLQRNALEYTNDLILLLTESLKNMDNMQGSGSGNSKPKKRNKSKGEPSLGDMRKSQENMKNQLQQMLEQMKDGKGNNTQSKNEKLGKMLAQQEIFQNMLNKMQSGSGVGQETSKKLNEIKQMLEQNKRDLVNSNLNKNTINRQQQIITRLLEAEKAEIERDKDDKRESKNVYNYKKSNPKNLFDDIDENVNFNDLLYKNNLHLQPFYINKFHDYLKKINTINHE